MALLSRLCAISLVIAASFAAVYCVRLDEQPSSVYFALMVSSAPTLNTSGVVSAVDQALAIVNNDRSDILLGVRLQYTTVLDTQVNFVSLIHDALTKLMQGAIIIASTAIINC